jgi:hypothetical protein
MRWARRTDDARRTKGDPPPTYAQLQATVANLTGLVRQQGEIVRNLRSQVDGLMVENAGLRAVLEPHPKTSPESQQLLTKYGPKVVWPIELGVEAAESKPDGRELDPDPTRLYVLPDYGIDHRKDEER